MQETKTFEDFIMKCCEMDEWDLRDFLRNTLKEAGFTIQEDDYSSYRLGRYQEVHNMLAIRGEKAKVCLVAHTDVCRDHGYNTREHKKTEPVIKEINTSKGTVRIIQDKNNKVQVGGDDRLGVAINTWIALNTGYDMGLLFTSDEEVGNQSAEECKFSDLMKFDICVQVDRGNHSNQLVTNIGNTRLCDGKTANRLLRIASEMGLPRVPVNGLMTDVLALTQKRRIKNAVNMTCGYHQSFGAGANEFINVEEARDTMKYVSHIIQNYEIELIENLEDAQNNNEKSEDKDMISNTAIYMQWESDNWDDYYESFGY